MCLVHIPRARVKKNCDKRVIFYGGLLLTNQEIAQNLRNLKKKIE